MYLLPFLLVFNSFATLSLAQTSSCTGQQYNDLPGFPASNSGCYPTNYYQTYDLGNTNPDDARIRCEQYCTSDGDKCKSVVAQVNKAADSNLYSGTCFLYAPGQTVTPRQCANTAYLLEGYYKDGTNACFSASSSSASKFCSSYLGIPLIIRTVTATPPVATVTTTTTMKPTVQITSTVTTTPTFTVSATLTTTITVATSTQVMTAATVTSSQVRTTTLTSTVETTNGLSYGRRRAVATVSPPACVTSDTPATRLSAACSCLSVRTSTTKTTTTLSQVTSTSTRTVTSPVSVTNTETATAPPVTTTITGTVTSSVTAMTTTTVTPVTTTTSTSTSITTTLVPQCSAGTVQNSLVDVVFNTHCNTQCVTLGVVNKLLGSGTVQDFNACIGFCSQYATILVVEYYEPAASCVCYFTSSNNLISNSPGYDCAVAQGFGLYGG